MWSPTVRVTKRIASFPTRVVRLGYRQESRLNTAERTWFGERRKHRRFNVTIEHRCFDHIHGESTLHTLYVFGGSVALGGSGQTMGGVLSTLVKIARFTSARRHVKLPLSAALAVLVWYFAINKKISLWRKLVASMYGLRPYENLVSVKDVRTPMRDGVLLTSTVLFPSLKPGQQRSVRAARASLCVSHIVAPDAPADFATWYC